MRKRTTPSLAELLQHGGWTRQLARGLVGSDVAADDVLQDTWVAALRRPPDPGRPLRPWLGTVIRNKVFNRARERVRRDAREARADASEGSESAESLLGRLEIHKILVDVVSELAEPYRQTVLLAYFEELTSAEIGERNNVPASTIRGRLKTALQLLREALDVRLGSRSAWLVAVTDLSHPPPTRPARSQTGGTRASVGSRDAVSARAAGGVLIPAAVGLVGLVATATIWSVGKASGSSQQRTASAESASLSSKPDERGAPGRGISGGGVSTPLFQGASAASQLFPLSSSARLGVPMAGLTIHGAVLAGGAGVAEAVVRIVGARPIRTDHFETPKIFQGHCFPHVLLVARGGPLVLQNDDDVPHAVAVTREAVELFKTSISARARATIPIPDGTEVLQLHVLDGGGPASFVVPSDPGLAAKTDAIGGFAFPGVPAGDYTLEVWDEALGTKDFEVAARLMALPLRLVFGWEPRSDPARFARSSGGSAACTIALRGDGPAAKACATGGRDEAKKRMKAVVRQAKSRGINVANAQSGP